MSAAFLAAIAALAPLIPGIVQGVEKLFGPKTGPTKMQTATNMLEQLAQALGTAGKLNGVPNAQELQALIETVVQALKAQGQLGGAAQSIAALPAPGTYNIVLTVSEEKKAAA